MKPLSLNIPKPCTEKWTNFSPTSTGGFCTSCSKVVTDFTVMSDEQIIILVSNSSQPVCGRFRPDQMKTYIPVASVNIRPGFTLLRASLMGLFILLVSKPASARMLHEKLKTEMVFSSDERVEESSSMNQTPVITGIVRDKWDKSGLPGINVYIEGRTEGTVTDVNGRFVLRATVQAGDVLVFSFIGYETKEYKVPKAIDEVLELDIELYMDVSIMGEVAVNDVYQNPPTGIIGIWNKVKAWF